MSEEIKRRGGSDILLKEPIIDDEKPISDIYPIIDTDLGRDNVENDIPEADLQDL